MEQWLEKEFQFQGIHQVSSYLKNEMKIDKKSILDDFTSHITISGSTFFNKCWSIAVLLSRLQERERLSIDKNYKRILPHPLCLLIINESGTDKYILATKQTLDVPKDEYKQLYNNLKSTDGPYNIPIYGNARTYLTILLELIRLFTIQVPTTPKTQLLAYDEINNCVTLRVACLRNGNCSNYKQLLYLNLELENQLSKLVGKFPYYKFIQRSNNITIQDFIGSTFFPQQITDKNDDQPNANTNAKLDDAVTNAKDEAKVVEQAEPSGKKKSVTDNKAVEDTNVQSDVDADIEAESSWAKNAADENLPIADTYAKSDVDAESVVVQTEPSGKKKSVTDNKAVEDTNVHPDVDADIEAESSVAKKDANENLPIVDPNAKSDVDAESVVVQAEPSGKKKSATDNKAVEDTNVQSDVDGDIEAETSVAKKAADENLPITDTNAKGTETEEESSSTAAKQDIQVKALAAQKTANEHLSVSNANDDEENNIEDNFDPNTLKVVVNQNNNSHTDNGQLVPHKSILLMGMSTVNIEETAKTKGTTIVSNPITPAMARHCVNRKIISVTDGRDLARINSIKLHNKSDVYTVSLVNTNSFNDKSSNPTVYDTSRHLHADYNCRHFSSSLEMMLTRGEQTVRFQEMTVDYYYMPSVSSGPIQLVSILTVYWKDVLTAVLIPYHMHHFEF